MRRRFAFALAVPLAFAFVPGSGASRLRAAGEAAELDPPAAAVDSITTREIGGHLRFLASDLMRGRDTTSPEIRIAAEYLATRLYAADVKPLGDPGPKGRTYFQRYPLEAVTPLSEGARLELTLDLGGSRRVVACRLGDDYTFRADGVVGGQVDSDVVFAGYGREEDYGELDVVNRFVLVFQGAPEDAQGEGKPRSSASAYAKRETARKRGALGLLLIQPPGKSANPPRVPFTARDHGFDRTRILASTIRTEPPSLVLADPIRDLLVDSLKLRVDGDHRPETPSGKLRARFRHEVKREPREDRNVLGYLPGVDPRKKNEVVVFSAHYDHEGVDAEGEIYNGSDDNASGTSALLEIAQAFSLAPRPARTVMFLWVSGEEKGLLGSAWYAEHRLLPEGASIVADVNLDMVSRNDSGKIGVTPSPRHPDYNGLIPAAVEICKSEGLEAVFDTDPFYARTDSYNFARKGIPVIFFFSGLHEDYHKPTDDVEKADLDKAARVARSAFRLGWRAAQADEAPGKIPAPDDSKANAKPSGEPGSNP